MRIRHMVTEMWRVTLDGESVEQTATVWRKTQSTEATADTASEFIGFNLFCNKHESFECEHIQAIKDEDEYIPHPREHWA